MLSPNDAFEAISKGSSANEVEHQQIEFKVKGHSRSDTVDDLAEAAAWE